MYDADLPASAPGPSDAGGPAAELDAAVSRAAAGLRRWQKPDGHWVFELEADATIPAEHLLLRRFLGEPHDPELERRTANYLRRIQGAHGGWPLFHDGAFDISATVKAYFALRFAGDAPEAPHMARAREAVLAHGGAAAVNVFSRIQLALFGVAPPGRAPWSDIPTMPPELILAPRWFPIHLGKMSYWARTVIAPLLVLGVLKPTARDTSVRLDELYLPAGSPLPPRKTHQKLAWRVGFEALDWALKRFEPFWPRRLRARAMARCRAFVVERLNGEDGLGAIYPAMANSVMMFAALGCAEDDPHRATARRSVAKLVVHAPEDGRPDEIYCQPCVSPVWDTALAAHALMEAGDAASETAALQGLAWLKPLQVLDVRGDWAEVKPDVRPGGWAFQYRNDHYPDLDDTAVVVMAMDRARGRLSAGGYDEAIARGEEWTVGLQSRNGGFGAFDADNAHHYLNNIPFADHGALLDPPTEDVTGPRGLHDGAAGRAGGQPAHEGRLPLPGGDAAPRRVMVRPLGGELHLRRLVGDVRAPRGGLRRRRPRHEARRRLAPRHPERRRRLGRGLRELRPRLRRLRPAPVRGVADGVGAAGADGRRADGRPRRGARRRVAAGAAGRRRAVAAGALHGRRLPARLLPALPRLSQVLPAVGGGALPQPAPRQHARGGVGDVTLLVVTGLLAEAGIAAGQGVVTLAGGGAADLDRRIEQAIAAHRPSAVLSFGVAGALHPSLAVGDVVAGAEVVGDGWSAPCDAAWLAALAPACRARPAVVTALPVPASTVEMKRALARLGAATVDMETGAAALAAREAGLPFAVLRVVSDTAAQAIPPAALAGMREDGRTDAAAVLASLVRAPGQLPALVRTARDFGRAMRRLREVRAAAGPLFSLPG